MTWLRNGAAARAAVAGAVAMAAIAAWAPGGASASAGGARDPGAGTPTHAYAWGDNSAGQIGDGGGGTTRTSPVAVAHEGLRFTQVAAGADHSLAVGADGTLYAWGANHHGQLGDGTNQDRPTPTLVPGLTNIKDIAAGNGYSLALRADGTVWSWGVNGSGQLGGGASGGARPNPRQVPTLTGVVDLAAGNAHSLALRDNGTVWAWGSNNYGQLGDESNVNRATPVQVMTRARAIAAGYDHSLALHGSRSVWAWGANHSGQLGDGTRTHSSAPVPLGALPGAKDVGAGAHHSMAIGDGDALYAWGANSYGQLGDGTKTGRTTPHLVPGIGGVAKVTGGFSHTAAVGTDGTVWTWGSNEGGHLGDGGTADRLTPAQVPGLSGVTDIDVGYRHRAYRRLSHTLVIRPTAGPTFSIALSAETISLPAGGSATLTVTSEPYTTPPQTLRLSVGPAPGGSAHATGLPAGISAVFSPATITTGGTSTLTLTAAPDVVSRGEPLPLAVTALGDSGAASATFDLQITPATE